MFSHEVGLLVGAGIGVTPFASILKSIFYRKESGDKSLCLEKVYFYWLCPSMQSFEWFRDLLINIERQLVGRYVSSEHRVGLASSPGSSQFFNVAR